MASASVNIDTLAESPGWRILKAVQERRYANTSDAIERTSPRIVSAIADLARQFHPEAFNPPGTIPWQAAPPIPTEDTPLPTEVKPTPKPPQAQLESIGIAECACAR
jgi:hypothetical protein